MRRSLIGGLLVVAATSLPLLVSFASAVGASSRAAPSIGTQLAELKGSNTVADDSFGFSVAISGTTVVVGAPGHAENAGRAYVFTKTAGVWEQTAELKGSDTTAHDGFGDSVAISGTDIVVGAPGHAFGTGGGRAYVFTKTSIGWKQAAELKSSDTVVGDEFGFSVAISGTTAIVGALGHAGGGRAYVFTKRVAVWKQTAELKGSDTVAGDWFGISVAISGTTVLVGADGHAFVAGRAYVFTKRATVWKQTAELKGADTVAGDDFGGSVAISGSTVVVGAFSRDNSAGRTYVFTKTASGWIQTAELKGFDTVAGDEFGFPVVISGTTVVVGACGHARNAGRVDVFTKTAGVWKEKAELKGSDTVGVLGYSVAISGTTVVVGAYDRAYVFTKTASGWDQVAELEGSDSVRDDDFGDSVAISGTTAIVGENNYPNYPGRAYVFTKTASGWDQVAELEGSDSVPDDDFGDSVAISGTTAIVGADEAAYRDAGRAYVFAKTASGWEQTAELKGSDTVGKDQFGWSVAISGTTAIVGALNHANGAGRAYVFTKTAGVWKQTAELKGSDTVAYDSFGWSVAVSGTMAVVGANTQVGGGRAYVFTKRAAVWKQTAELKGSDTVAFDDFGTSVAISGMTAIVGADNHANGAGTAYVFTKTASGWKQVAELKGSDTVAFDDFGGSVAISGTTAVVGESDKAYVFIRTATGWKQAAELKGSDTVVGDEFGFSVAISGTTAIVGALGHAGGGRAYVFEA